MNYTQYRDLFGTLDMDREGTEGTDEASLFASRRKQNTPPETESVTIQRPDAENWATERKENIRGWPKGSKIKKRTIEDSEERKGNGKHFKRDEDIFLGKPWIKKSMKGPNKIQDKMWNELEDNCRGGYGMKRTAASLRVNWKSLQRKSQHYFETKKMARTKRKMGKQTMK